VQKKKLTEDKFTDAFKQGITAMHGRENGDQMTLTAMSFAHRLEMKVQKTHEKDMDYPALFAQRKSNKSADKVTHQRQWASLWLQKTQRPLLPGSPTGKPSAPFMAGHDQAIAIERLPDMTERLPDINPAARTPSLSSSFSVQ
jgi:hypothetical protein